MSASDLRNINHWLFLKAEVIDRISDFRGGLCLILRHKQLHLAVIILARSSRLSVDSSGVLFDQIRSVASSTDSSASARSCFASGPYSVKR